MANEYFTHHPDNLFIICGFLIPAEIFLSFEPGYYLLPQYHGQHYEPGVAHYLILADGSGNVPADLNWYDGDQYISKVEYYKRAADQKSSYNERITFQPTVNVIRSIQNAWH